MGRDSRRTVDLPRENATRRRQSRVGLLRGLPPRLGHNHGQKQGRLLLLADDLQPNDCLSQKRTSNMIAIFYTKLVN